jgi:hypothetical protein
MKQDSNFGTGGFFAFSIVVLLATSVWIGPVALGALVIWVLTYRMLIREVNEWFNPDGSRKRNRRRH